MTEPSDHPTRSQVRGEAGTSVTSLAHLIPQLEDQRIKNLVGALIKTAPHLRGVQIGSIFLFSFLLNCPLNRTSQSWSLLNRFAAKLARENIGREEDTESHL